MLLLQWERSERSKINVLPLHTSLENKCLTTSSELGAVDPGDIMVNRLEIISPLRELGRQVLQTANF